MRTKDGSGLRFNQGKLRLDLISPFAMKGLAEVLTKGAEKYGDRNWEQGMPWSKVIASLKRHLNEIESGIDYDKEDGLLHIDHLLCNAMFLSHYYRKYIQGDDRTALWHHYPNIVLDIDGVICNFDKGFYEFAAKKNIPIPEGFDIPHHWYFSYELNKLWPTLASDKDFWLSLPPLIDGKKLPINPIAYVTARPIDSSISQQWLEKHHFPCQKVVTVKPEESKVEALKKLGAEVFVDDKWENFTEATNAGILTFLMDAPYNRKYEVGVRRIYSLEDILDKI